MLRTTRSKVRFNRALAMAIALVGGTVTASTLIAPAAAAQEYTEGFVAAYNAVDAITKSGATDFSSARPLLPAMLAAISNNDERNAAGRLLLAVGQNQRDPAMQRQAIELILASGQVPVEAQAQYQYYIGNFAMQMSDFAASRAALRLAIAGGYMPADAAQNATFDPRTQILQGYFIEEDYAGLMATAGEFVAAGGPSVPEQWLAYGLQAAIELQDLDNASMFSQALVRQYPTNRNWGNALRTITGLGDFDDQANLDLLRLMRLTGTIASRNEFASYVEAADPRIMSNEVSDVLAEGLAAGEFTATETYYTEVKGIADDRMAGDRADAPIMVREARAAANGRDALLAGNLLYSLDDFAGAEEMFALAVSKGGVDTPTALTRLGIAQIRQGNNAAAIETLAQVTGPRALIAQMWSLYAAGQAG